MYSMMKMLTFFSLVMVIPEVCSLKCYNCAKSSLSECEKNQTVVDCPSLCGTSAFNISFNGGIYFMQIYTKTCAGPSSNCSSLFNETVVLKVQSCMYLKRCSTDYCNGVPPTTAIPVTKGMSKSTEGSSDASEMTTKRAINKGSRLGNTLGVSIVELLTVGLMTIMTTDIFT